MALEQIPIQPKAEPKPHLPSSGIVPALNPERWLEDYGDMLFGFAMVRVRDRGVAQELSRKRFWPPSGPVKVSRDALPNAPGCLGFSAIKWRTITVSKAGKYPWLTWSIPAPRKMGFFISVEWGRTVG